jgi:hypothetical protein
MQERGGTRRRMTLIGLFLPCRLDRSPVFREVTVVVTECCTRKPSVVKLSKGVVEWRRGGRFVDVESYRLAREQARRLRVQVAELATKAKKLCARIQYRTPNICFNVQCFS